MWPRRLGRQGRRGVLFKLEGITTRCWCIRGQYRARCDHFMTLAGSRVACGVHARRMMTPGLASRYSLAAEFLFFCLSVRAAATGTVADCTAMPRMTPGGRRGHQLARRVSNTRSQSSAPANEGGGSKGGGLVFQSFIVDCRSALMENGAGSEDDENIYEDIGVLQDRALDTARPIRRTSAVRTPSTTSELDFRTRRL